MAAILSWPQCDMLLIATLGLCTALSYQCALKLWWLIHLLATLDCLWRIQQNYHVVTIGSFNTLRPEMANILQTFSNVCSWMKSFEFPTIFGLNMFCWFNWQEVIFGSGNGWPPNRWEVITWNWSRYLMPYGVTRPCDDFTVMRINPLWPRDSIWHHRCSSTWDQLMACCLRASVHYLNQWWHLINELNI